MRDTLDGATCRLWDEGAARNLTAGDRIAARLIPIDDWWVTSGTASMGIPGPIAELARTLLPAMWHHPSEWPQVGTAERDRLTLKLMAACHPESDGVDPMVATAPRHHRSHQFAGGFGEGDVGER